MTIVLVAITLAACSPAADGPFDLVVEPEFVQGVIPGERMVLLVTVDEPEAGGPVDLAVSSTGGTLTPATAQVTGGAVVEITYVADPVPEGDEVPITIAVTATRGATEQRHEVSTVVVPWEDTIADTAGEILAVFTRWLADQEPDLGITPDTPFEGTVVAPMLLVVTHYAFFGDDWELGLSWHIMVAPDDWSEVYLRPRDALSPTRAFRLTSWSTALGGGAFEIREVAPPTEVVR